MKDDLNTLNHLLLSFTKMNKSKDREDLDESESSLQLYLLLRKAATPHKKQEKSSLNHMLK